MILWRSIVHRKALLKRTNYLVLTADEGDCSALILFDVSAAFDTVDHTILIDCLKHRVGVFGSAQFPRAHHSAVKKKVISSKSSAEIDLSVLYFTTHPMPTKLI